MPSQNHLPALYQIHINEMLDKLGTFTCTLPNTYQWDVGHIWNVYLHFTKYISMRCWTNLERLPALYQIHINEMLDKLGTFNCTLPNTYQWDVGHTWNVYLHFTKYISMRCLTNVERLTALYQIHINEMLDILGTFTCTLPNTYQWDVWHTLNIHLGAVSLTFLSILKRGFTPIFSATLSYGKNSVSP